jgi:hypothetical protein
MKVYIYFLCLFGCFIIATKCQTACTKVERKPSCVCETEDGLIDLSSVGSDDGTPRFSKVQGENLGRFTYEYNPCYGFVYGTTGCSDGQAAACQNDDVDPNAQYSCGKMSTETFILNAGTQNNELKYTAGDDGRDTTVELVCDESADTPILNALDDYPDYFKYKFKLTTKCACPGLCEGGGGGGGDGPVGEIGLVLIIL